MEIVGELSPTSVTYTTRSVKNSLTFHFGAKTSHTYFLFEEDIALGAKEEVSPHDSYNVHRNHKKAKLCILLQEQLKRNYVHGSL